MAYVVTDKCIDCKFTDCVPVCPVDAFHEGENTLVINPSVCIDCSLCEDACPIDAIISEDTDHEKMDDFLDFAEQKSDIWPVIIHQQKPLPLAKIAQQMRTNGNKDLTKQHIINNRFLTFVKNYDNMGFVTWD